MENPDRPLFAIAIRLLAVGLMASMIALVKVASERGVALPEILFWRQVMTMPLLAGWLAAHGALSHLRTARIGAHGKRAAMGLSGMALNFGAVTLLPLAEATTLNFTSPMFAVLMSALVLKEKVGVWRWSAVVLGFFGVVIITGPDGGNLPLLGTVVAVSAAFLISIISIQVRDLGRTEKSITTVFYFSAFSMVPLLPILPFVMKPHDLVTWGVLMAMGLIGAFGQMALTAALKFGKVSTVMVMDYTALFWAALWGYLGWNVLPAATTWIGAPLIIAAGLVVLWREQRLARERRLRSAPLPQ